MREVTGIFKKRHWRLQRTSVKAAHQGNVSANVCVGHGHTWITVFGSRFWGQSHGSTVPSEHILSYLFNDSQWSHRFISYEQDVRSNWKMTLIHYSYARSLRSNWRIFQKLISLWKLTVSLPSSSWSQPARLCSCLSFSSAHLPSNILARTHHLSRTAVLPELWTCSSNLWFYFQTPGCVSSALLYSLPRITSQGKSPSMPQTPPHTMWLSV